MSFWSALGGDVKKVWSLFSSPKAQAVVGAGEQIVEDFWPASTGLFNLINSWGMEVMKVQGISEAAAATPGADTNAAKAAAVLSVVTPQVTAFLTQYKLPVLAMTDINTVNTKIVDILNILTGASKATATNTAVPGAATQTGATGK